MEHSFNPKFATKYGMVAAVIFHDLVFWCNHNRANGTHFYDGHTWTYNSAKAFQELYPYMGKSQIYSAIQKMMEDGLIIKGNYNENKFDHKPWYAVTERGYEVLGECESENRTPDVPKIEHSTSDNCNDVVDESLHRRSNNPTSNIYYSNIYDSNTDTVTDTVADAAVCAREREAAGENPYGDGDDTRPDFDTVEIYASQQLALTPGNMQEFEQFKSELPEALIRHAIDEAGAARIKTWSYVRGILRRYIADGITTVEQAIDAENARKDYKARSSPTPQRKMTAAEESDAFWSKVPTYY